VSNLENLTGLVVLRSGDGTTLPPVLCLRLSYVDGGGKGGSGRLTRVVLCFGWRLVGTAAAVLCMVGSCPRGFRCCVVSATWRALRNSSRLYDSAE
jgi:hypothetical protein